MLQRRPGTDGLAQDAQQDEVAMDGQRRNLDSKNRRVETPESIDTPMTGDGDFLRNTYVATIRFRLKTHGILQCASQ